MIALRKGQGLGAGEISHPVNGILSDIPSSGILNEQEYASTLTSSKKHSPSAEAAWMARAKTATPRTELARKNHPLGEATSSNLCFFWSAKRSCFTPIKGGGVHA
jgi:hypothetical protein